MPSQPAIVVAFGVATNSREYSARKTGRARVGLRIATMPISGKYTESAPRRYSLSSPLANGTAPPLLYRSANSAGKACDV
eukprot:Skav208130  [mRNA]  locus=scaffold1223:188480:189752:+ [translate_table: standard]